MGHSSTSPSSVAHNRSLQQSFIENWIMKTSNQHTFDDIQNEQEESAATDINRSDLPPWASPRKPDSSWHKLRESFVISDEEEKEESNNFEDSFNSLPNIIDDDDDQEKNEESLQNKNSYPFSENEYSVMATTTKFIPLSDEEEKEEEEEGEETTAGYKTASTTLHSPDIIHKEIDHEYENEVKELCKPHAAPSFIEIVESDSQDTVPYGESETEDGDTQPYNADGEETEEEENTQPCYADTQPHNQYEARGSLPEIPYDIPKDEFVLMPDLLDIVDDGEYVSPLVSAAGDEDIVFDNVSPIPLPFENEEIQEEDLIDELTENDILQLEQEVALKINTTRKGKRKAVSPIPVSPGSQIVRLDKKQIRTSIVKKPTTIDDYFLHPTTVNDETGIKSIIWLIHTKTNHLLIEQDIGKESNTPSFTISSNEDINKKPDSQLDTRRRPRFGLSKKRYH